MMKFQHFAEAEKSALAINQELRLRAVFGEMEFACRVSVRKQIRKGITTWFLNEWLATIACSVPSLCDVTYLKPTSQLGMEALELLQGNYPRMRVRKKEKQTPAEERMQAFADKMHKN